MSLIESIQNLKARVEQVKQDYAWSEDAQELRETLCHLTTTIDEYLVDSIKEETERIELVDAIVLAISEVNKEKVLVPSELLGFLRMSTATDAAYIRELSPDDMRAPEVKERFEKLARLVDRLTTNTAPIEVRR